MEPASVICELRSSIAKGEMGPVCNGIKDMFRVYMPLLGPGATNSDAKEAIAGVAHEWERKRFAEVLIMLERVEEVLFRHPDDLEGHKGALQPTLNRLAFIVRELGPRQVYWRRRLFNLKRRATKPLIYLKSVRRWRKPWRR